MKQNFDQNYRVKGSEITITNKQKDINIWIYSVKNIIKLRIDQNLVEV